MCLTFCNPREKNQNQSLMEINKQTKNAFELKIEYKLKFQKPEIPTIVNGNAALNK